MVTSATNSLPATYTATASATDATAPTVSISSPLAGSTFSGGRITLAASVSDTSAVKSVEFRVDGVLVATDAAAPHTANWNARKAATGPHTVTVKAYDAAGNVGPQAIVVNIR